LVVLDRPGVGRQPIRPMAIREDGKLPRQAVPASLDLRGLDADAPGLNRMKLHGYPPLCWPLGPGSARRLRRRLSGTRGGYFAITGARSALGKYFSIFGSTPFFFISP